MPAKNKTQPSHASLQAYINSISDNVRSKDALTLSKIMQEATGEMPVMWGSAIVGYGNYHYVYPTGREGDTPAVGFSARKAALTIYGLFHYEQNIAMTAQLGTYTHGKGCVYIKSLDDINIAVLKQMISSAYIARNN